MDWEALAVAKAFCNKKAGLTKNQIAVALVVVTSGGTMEDIAKDLGISNVSLYGTMRRIDKKCPGFRERVRALRSKDFTVYRVSDLNSSKLSDSDYKTLNEMLLDVDND